MTRRSGALAGRHPASFLVAGEWPDGRLARDAPVAARYVRTISIRLRDALADANLADVAARSHLARSTIYDLLAGTTWPDVVSLAQLEEALGTRLWPTE